LLLVLLLASFPALDGPSTSQPEAAGIEALDRQDFAQAEQIFSKLAAQDPKDYSALFNLALAEGGLHKDAEAASHYQQVLALKPGLYEAQLNLGILDLRAGKASDAIPLLRASSHAKPDKAAPARYLGEALLTAGSFPEAADAYRSALRIDPKQATAELGLGQSLLRQNKLDEAAPHYRAAVQYDPSLHSYLLEIASAFSSAHRPDDAIPLLKLFPDDAGAREELGRLYLATNRPAEAIPEFQAAATLSPTAANQVALASAYVKNNQPDLAEPILKQSLAANPNDYDLLMVVGRIRRDKHDYLEAAKLFQAAAALHHDSVEAWNETAVALVLAERYSEGLTALDKVHSLNGETVGDFYYRAIVLDKLHQVKPALASYQRFLQASGGKYPDQEFIARQRSRILEREANR
jgi:tetratricopeptide (TPR) repeat protein